MMSKTTVVFVALIMILGISTGHSIGSSATTNIVNCDQDQGCFGLIEEQIMLANSGDVIQIGPGVYYERPLTIDKELTLEAAGDEAPQIRFVDYGTGIKIVPSNDPITNTSVKLSNLVISANVAHFGEFSAENIAISVENEDSQLELSVNIVGVEVTGNQGIQIENASLNIEDSNVYYRDVGIYSKNADLEIVRSVIRHEQQGPDAILETGIFAQDTSLILRNTSVVGGRLGMWLLGEGIYELSSNSLNLNDIAVSLSGEIHIDFTGNNFALIEEFAIRLPLAPCVNNPQSAVNISITGSGNTFEISNGQFICPSDYPLPEGFIAVEN